MVKFDKNVWEIDEINTSSVLGYKTFKFALATIK